MTALEPTVVVGVVGAGTMGTGIAQVAAAAGHRVVLADARSGAAAQAIERLRGTLDGLVSRGKSTAAERDGILGRIESADDLGPFDRCGLVVEAIAENPDAKRRLFAELEARVPDTALLATNTSSISVTALAASLRAPGRFAGMHFFNPAPMMKLVEIVAGLQSAEPTIATLLETARAWGKIAVRVRSTPGFVVNRVARPYYGEALRLLEENAAAPATIDALLVDGWGFRMGPCALMDLIGHDVNFAVTRSVFDGFFGEPRYRPSPIQKELVDAGWLGRKAGKGFFDHGAGAENPAPSELACEGGDTPIACDGEDLLVDGILIARTDGRMASTRARIENRPTVLYDHAAAGATRVALSASGVEPVALRRIASRFKAAGLTASLVADRPGLVVGRTVAMLVNEAYEAALQGVADERAIDEAMVHGVAYPGGPFAWARALGPSALASMLDAIFRETGDPRYRASLALRAAA